MPQIRAFGMVIGTRSPRKEAAVLRGLAESGFAIAKSLSVVGEYDDSYLTWNEAAELADWADMAEQDRRRFVIRRDTWTAPADRARPVAMLPDEQPQNSD